MGTPARMGLSRCGGTGADLRRAVRDKGAPAGGRARAAARPFGQGRTEGGGAEDAGRGGLGAQKPPAPSALGPCGARPEPERGTRSTGPQSGLVRCSREEAGATRLLSRACLESAPPSDLGRQRPGLPSHAGGRNLRRWCGPGLQSWTQLPLRSCVRIAQFLASLGRLRPQLE